MYTYMWSPKMAKFRTKRRKAAAIKFIIHYECCACVRAHFAAIIQQCNDILHEQQHTKIVKCLPDKESL